MAERMSFEEFWKKTFPHCQPIKGYGLAKTAWHHQQLTIDAQAKQIEDLQEWKDDAIAAQKVIMEERCPTDEVHCTCVPVLRKKIAELEAKVKELEEGRQLQQTRDVLRAMAPSKIPFIGTTGL